MKRFSSDCPFCLERHVGFRIVCCESLRELDGRNLTGAAQCANTKCRRDVSFEAIVLAPEDRNTILSKPNNGFEENVDRVFNNLKVFPSPPAPDIPDFLPDEIHRLFSDAEAVRLIGEQGASASVGQYRSVLDKTLPALAQEANVSTTDNKGKDLSRFPLLDRLSEADVLPKSIRSWIGSDGIRKILTDASHGEKITTKQAREISEITHFILVYIFTLPERVKRAHDEFVKGA